MDAARVQRQTLPPLLQNRWVLMRCSSVTTEFKRQLSTKVPLIGILQFWYTFADCHSYATTWTFGKVTPPTHTHSARIGKQIVAAPLDIPRGVMTTTRVYLHEKDEYVGPFYRRQDAELFLALMELFGESLEGIEIVEIETTAKTVSNAVSIKERKRLLHERKQ